MPTKIIELTGQVNLFVKENSEKLRRVLIHPSARREKKIDGQNRYDFYARKGEALYCLRCLAFLQRLGIADDSNRSLHLMNGFNSAVYMADFIERVGVLKYLSAGAACLSNASEKEKANISRTVYYILVALVEEVGNSKVMDCLTRGFTATCYPDFCTRKAASASITRPWSKDCSKAIFPVWCGNPLAKMKKERVFGSNCILKRNPFTKKRAAPSKPCAKKAIKNCFLQ